MNSKVNDTKPKSKQPNLRKKTSPRITKNKKGKLPRKQHGFVYLGHIPHGFYEEEMRSYFGQFGKVINVRLYRSPRTGKSQGYAFIEFEHSEVAKIAAETMDNYLMFKKRLEAKFVPADKLKNLRMSFTPSWTAENYPLKEKRERLNQAKNADPDHDTYIRHCHKWMSSVRKTMLKLKELGIDYAFQPIDVPVELKNVF
uniref:RRM domain-containing protein n=1 Tax=Photinus pyralis TaxID=7054 RepID=A0A1Y1MPF7_PHOPY